MRRKTQLLSVGLAVGVLLGPSFAWPPTLTLPEDIQRAYFRVVHHDGNQVVRSITRHSFPGNVVSIEAPASTIAILQQNPHLEFRGNVSRWQFDPPGQTFSHRGTAAGSRACVLSNYGLEQVPYGMKQLYRDPRLSQTAGGAGIDVAVLDTGVLKTHPDLTRRIERCRDATGTRIRNGCSDRDGHGTNVASIIAADAGADGRGLWGVAPHADLWIYKVCGRSCWSDDVARALYEVTDLGAEVVNMSFGGNGLAADEKAALDYAASRGVLLVAAAGNSGPGANTIGYPGADTKVMGIAAIDENTIVADFSSRGVNDGDYVVEEREVEMAAAGVKVLGAYKDGCYAWYWGTSQATPHVSGLAAKLWQGSGPTTRTFLQNRAQVTDLDVPGDDQATGFGLPTVP